MRHTMKAMQRTASLRRQGALSLVLVACLVMASKAEVTVRDLIGNVRSAEALYENCDVSVVMEYKRSEEAPPPTFEGPVAQKVRGEIRCVFQQGMLHLDAAVDLEYSEDDGDRSSRSYARTRLYDGTVTRVLEGRVVNIIDSPPVDEHVFRPHTVLFQDVTYPVPLSVWMQGEKALLAYPGRVFTTTSRRIECTHLGEEEWGGHPCSKISIRFTSTKTGKVMHEFVIWLAMDRNYLPIHYVGYKHRWSSDLAYNEGVVLEFKELSPGVWFPRRTVTTMYDYVALSRDDKQVVKATRSYEVVDVSLAPNHPIEFFRDLTVPDNSIVYRVDGSGEITESYRTGQ